MEGFTIERVGEDYQDYVIFLNGHVVTSLDGSGTNWQAATKEVDNIKRIASILNIRVTEKISNS